MHIEFNAGGFGGFNIAVFQERTWRFEQSVDTVKNGFSRVPGKPVMLQQMSADGFQIITVQVNQLSAGFAFTVKMR